MSLIVILLAATALDLLAALLIARCCGINNLEADQ